MFVVNEFRWLSTKDPRNESFSNWSRPYEYAFVLDRIRALNRADLSIHNTCCGYSEIHMGFAKMLQALSHNVVHTDLASSIEYGATTAKKLGIEIGLYDITTPNDRQFDVVVCVSSLEDVVFHSNSQEQAFHNLINQVRPGGKLLLTCDYPGVSVEFCEDLLGQRIAPDDGHILTDSYVLGIIAIDLTKKDTLQ